MNWTLNSWTVASKFYVCNLPQLFFSISTASPRHSRLRECLLLHGRGRLKIFQCRCEKIKCANQQRKVETWYKMKGIPNCQRNNLSLLRWLAKRLDQGDASWQALAWCSFARSPRQPCTPFTIVASKWVRWWIKRFIETCLFLCLDKTGRKYFISQDRGKWSVFVPTGRLLHGMQHLLYADRLSQHTSPCLVCFFWHNNWMTCDLIIWSTSIPVIRVICKSPNHLFLTSVLLDWGRWTASTSSFVVGALKDVSLRTFAMRTAKDNFDIMLFYIIYIIINMTRL